MKGRLQRSEPALQPSPLTSQDSRLRIHRHLHPLLVLLLELDDPVDVGVQRVVLREEDVLPRMELGAALLDEDRARGDPLAAEVLDAEVLGIRVASVAAGADALLVCHGLPHPRTRSVILTSVNFWRWPVLRR